jgi:hypothetical protein
MYAPKSSFCRRRQSMLICVAFTTKLQKRNNPTKNEAAAATLFFLKL